MVSTILPKEYTVLVLDNDECLGSWGLASGIHSFFVYYIPVHTGIPVSECLKALKTSLVKHYFRNGGARPGTKNLLKLIQMYKYLGMVNNVSMFTSSSNKYDWVVFLKECLEEYAGTSGVYDSVFHNDNTLSSISSDGATLKSMSLLCTRLSLEENKTRIIIIDDKPHNIRGSGIRIPVSPYRHVVDEIHVNRLLDDVFDVLQGIYSPIVGIKTYPPDNFRKCIKNLVLVDKNGRKQDVYDNLHIHKCPLDQMNDTDLIEQSSKAFVKHILPVALIRSTSDNSFITIPSPISMKRSSSL